MVLPRARHGAFRGRCVRRTNYLSVRYGLTLSVEASVNQQHLRCLTSALAFRPGRTRSSSHCKLARPSRLHTFCLESFRLQQQAPPEIPFLEYANAIGNVYTAWLCGPSHYPYCNLGSSRPSGSLHTLFKLAEGVQYVGWQVEFQRALANLPAALFKRASSTCSSSSCQTKPWQGPKGTNTIGRSTT